jgi:hypothetical protein
VIVCKIQRTHNRTYHINKGTVECLVVDYALFIFMCLLYYTHKHSTVPLLILYVLFCSLYFTHTYWWNVWLLICDIVTIVQVIVGEIQRTHKRTYRINKGTVECLVVDYTKSLVLMLQYHISTTKHSNVPLFIQYVLWCACCILHTFTSTNVTISHINNQIFYHSLVYTVCTFMCSLYFTHTHYY